MEQQDDKKFRKIAYYHSLGKIQLLQKQGRESCSNYDL